MACLEPWEKSPTSVKLKQVDVGFYGVYGVSREDDIWMKGPDSWQIMEGKLTDISVGWKTVWGTDKEHRVYRMKQGQPWKRIEGSLRQVNSYCLQFCFYRYF